jgi:hypothetical protein
MKTELAAIHVISVLQIPMIFLGLVGNFLSFLVFSRKKFAKYSISVYFRAMAVSECLIVYRLVYDIINYFYSIKLNTVSSVWCKIHFYVPTGILPTSVWILACFSVDKMIHVLGKRQAFPYIEKKSFQLALVVGIASFHCFVYSYVPIKLELEQVSGSNGSNVISCPFENLPHYRFISFFFYSNRL